MLRRGQGLQGFRGASGNRTAGLSQGGRAAAAQHGPGPGQRLEPRGGRRSPGGRHRRCLGWMPWGIGRGTNVAMVGFFRPLMHKFEARGARVEILDAGQGIGDRDDFLPQAERLGPTPCCSPRPRSSTTPPKRCSAASPPVPGRPCWGRAPLWCPTLSPTCRCACWQAPYHWTMAPFSGPSGTARARRSSTASVARRWLWSGGFDRLPPLFIFEQFKHLQRLEVPHPSQAGAWRSPFMARRHDFHGFWHHF